MNPKQQKTPNWRLAIDCAVVFAIKKLKSRKAPGQDGIPVRVVVIDLRCDILNYNYLWLKPQLLPITITQILRQ